jgi:hypothetical protein
MQPGQWVSLKMTKFPVDSLATVKLLDRLGNTAATVGACAYAAFERLTWCYMCACCHVERSVSSHAYRPLPPPPAL